MKNLLLFGIWAVSIQAQTLPLGVVVSMPATSGVGFGIDTPLQTSFTVLITSGLSGPTQLSAIAKLPAGNLALWNAPITPPTFFVGRLCSASPLPACAGELRQTAPVFYPLTGGVGALPSLPAETIVAVTITPPGQDPFSLTTGSFLRGIEQSTDLMTITIIGNFDPTAATTVYLGLWPLAVHPQATLVLPDRIVLSLVEDRTTFARIPGWYPVTVLQNNICDTVMLRFQSPFTPRGPNDPGGTAGR